MSEIQSPADPSGHTTCMTYLHACMHAYLCMYVCTHILVHTYIQIALAIDIYIFGCGILGANGPIEIATSAAPRAIESWSSVQPKHFESWAFEKGVPIFLRPLGVATFVLRLLGT